MGVEILRTPEERFEGIDDFPYEPRYRRWRDLRLAHIDEGEGPAVVLVHGEPTWSYLWRKVMGPLLGAGYRCIVPDLPGFGRSDKPADPAWYSYDVHTEAVGDLFEVLDVGDVTLVMHDWGGPIGFRIATGAFLERVSRLVAMDTGVFDGNQRMSPDWLRFKEFVKRTPDLPIERMVRAGCKTTPPDEVLAAYAAPFPGKEHKAGAKAFPELIPLSPQEEGAEAGRTVAAALAGDDRPALILWGDSDAVLPLEEAGRGMERLLKEAGGLIKIEDAGHFLQEDRGEHVGTLIADWLASGE